MKIRPLKLFRRGLAFGAQFLPVGGEFVGKLLEPKDGGNVKKFIRERFKEQSTKAALANLLILIGSAFGFTVLDPEMAFGLATGLFALVNLVLALKVDK